VRTLAENHAVMTPPGVEGVEEGWGPIATLAEQRGVTVQAIHKDIKARRLKSWKRRGRIYLVHLERANQELDAAKDYTRAPGLAPAGGGEFDFQNEAAREKHWKANLAEIEYRVRAGELIPKEEVKEKFTAAVVAAKTKLLGISRRIQQRMPHISPEDVKSIHELVREALEDLAYGE